MPHVPSLFPAASSAPSVATPAAAGAAVAAAGPAAAVVVAAANASGDHPPLRPWMPHVPPLFPAASVASSVLPPAATGVAVAAAGLAAAVVVAAVAAVAFASGALFDVVSIQVLGPAHILALAAALPPPALLLCADVVAEVGHQH